MRSALRKILLLTVFCAGLAALWGQTVPGRRASCAMLEARAWLHREYCQPGGEEKGPAHVLRSHDASSPEGLPGKPVSHLPREPIWWPRGRRATL